MATSLGTRTGTARHIPAPPNGTGQVFPICATAGVAVPGGITRYYTYNCAATCKKCLAKMDKAWDEAHAENAAREAKATTAAAAKNKSDGAKTTRRALLARLEHGRDAEGRLLVEGFTVDKDATRAPSARWRGLHLGDDAPVLLGRTQTEVLERIAEWVDNGRVAPVEPDEDAVVTVRCGAAIDDSRVGRNEVAWLINNPRNGGDMVAWRKHCRTMVRVPEGASDTRCARHADPEALWERRNALGELSPRQRILAVAEERGWTVECDDAAGELYLTRSERRERVAMRLDGREGVRFAYDESDRPELYGLRGVLASLRRPAR